MKSAFGVFFENITNPVTGAEGVRQIVLLLMAFGLLHMDTTTQLLVISSVSGILSLFTRQSTVSNQRVDQKVEELVAHREMAGQTGTAIGLSKAITPPSVVS